MDGLGGRADGVREFCELRIRFPRVPVADKRGFVSVNANDIRREIVRVVAELLKVDADEVKANFI